MQSSQEVRQKLVAVIGNLICRCIEDARKIPYILGQEQVLEILVGNPAFFAELVRDEHRDRTAFADDRLTASLDAVAELGQLEALDAFDLSFSGRIATDAELDPLLDRINQLTRTFTVYTGNTVSIFEKEFRRFMEKLRLSLLQSEMVLTATDLTESDLAALEKGGEGYLYAGQFMQAFLFDRLLHADVITRELVRLPSSAHSLIRRFLSGALAREDLRPFLLKFILRVCYISLGTWQDLFDALLLVAEQEPDLCPRPMLIDKIEQDGVFCCNLLCDSYATLSKWSSAERRAAIGKKIERWEHKSQAS